MNTINVILANAFLHEHKLEINVVPKTTAQLMLHAKLVCVSMPLFLLVLD
jgi:hypothetical protein